MADDGLVVIAHRGASGYVPEHTLEAKAYAHALGAHYIEQDIVATRDNELIVLHDIHLDSVTNVADRYPDRRRDDGHYYARDFDLAEIQSLTVWERRNEEGVEAVYAGRFPTGIGEFRVPTLRSEIKFIQGLNQSTGRNVGIYPEIKRPAWHRAEGVDISVLVLRMLDDLGYRSKADPVFLQCFDAAEVRRIRHELGCPLKMVQLLGENDWGESDTDYEPLTASARGWASSYKWRISTANRSPPGSCRLPMKQAWSCTRIPSGRTNWPRDSTPWARWSRGLPKN